MKAFLTTAEYEGLSAEQKGMYAKAPDGGGGDYMIQLSGLPDGWALENVAGLKASVSSARGERDAAQKQLKVYADDEGVFLDAKTARDALAKVGDLANMTPNDKAKAAQDAAIAQVTEKYEKQVKDGTARTETLQKALEAAIIDASLTAAINAHGGNVELLRPALRPKLAMHEDDGTFTSRVLGDDGNPRLTMKTGSTDHMGVEEMVELTKSDPRYAPAFSGSGASGTGAQNTQAGSAGGTGGHTISAADARDPAKYKAAKEAAAKVGGSLSVEWDGSPA